MISIARPPDEGITSCLNSILTYLDTDDFFSHINRKLILALGEYYKGDFVPNNHFLIVLVDNFSHIYLSPIISDVKLLKLSSLNTVLRGFE